MRTKRYHYIRQILSASLCAFALWSNAPQANGQNQPTTKKHYSPKYWYIGAEYFSPMMFDELYSWTRNEYRIGTGVQGKLGYQFSTVFGLEATFGVGKNRMYTSPFQKNFRLGTYDAYTYYPYTLIEGTKYTHHYPNLIGEQGNNPEKVQVESTPFPNIRSDVKFWQAGLHANVNLTRLFYASHYSEKPVELWLKPGLYLSQFKTEVKERSTGKVVAPNVNRQLTLGMGADMMLRFNLSKHWALDLSNRLIWERDHAMDGVLNSKKAYDAYMWQPGIGITYKFRRKVQPTEILAPAPVPVPVAPVVEPQLPLELECWYPEEVELPVRKQRTHSATIYLTYILNKTFIAPELHNNPKELARLNNDIEKYLNNPNYSVKTIKVEGFASPEGPYDNNMRLASGRAASIINYIADRSKLNQGMFALGRTTENWDGLKDTLQKNPNLPGSDKVLRMIANTPDTEALKQNLKQVPEYKYLLENVYPHLRLSSYTVEYDVKTFAGQEAKELIKTNPTELSPEEMYAVATAYGIGTEEANQTIEILNKYYPTSDIARTYRGIKLVQNKQYEQAIDELQSVQKPNEYVWNALAVAYAHQGKVTKAKELLRKAAGKNTDARKNLNRLIRKEEKQ